MESFPPIDTVRCKRMMKCDNCKSEITFWMALKQPTPFRFKCSRCKAKYRVSTPRMKTILVGVVVLFVGLTLGLLFGTDELGFVFAIPFFFFMVGVWLMLEAWTHKYISNHGVFTKTGITEQKHEPDCS
jgi:hypothetical protein